MIKYNEKLENRQELYLPLIDKFEKGKVYCEYKLPLSFYIKNKYIFEESKNYINILKKVDINKYFDLNKFQSYESYRKACSIYEEYDSIIEALEENAEYYDKIDFEAKEVEWRILSVLRVLELLLEIYPHNKDIYEKSIKKFQNTYNEIKNMNQIVYDKNTVKYKKEYLLDAWFILPNQTLYNTGYGHKGTTLAYDFYHNINAYFNYEKSLIGASKYYFNLVNELKEKGFDACHFKKYVNHIYQPEYTDTSHEFPTCNEPNNLNFIIGVVTSKAYFYNFFENIQKYCSNPKEELEILKKLTNKSITDIFVRCCGFHKVESQLEKTITTSDVNYKESFKEYIEKGWNIVFIPPIIIQRDLGKISELDMESSFVKKYVK